MQKALTILFSIWLTVGSSCAVKAEVMQLLDGSQTTQMVKHAEKSGNVQIGQGQQELCSQTQQTVTDKYAVQNNGNHSENLPDLLFAFTGSFLWCFLYPGAVIKSTPPVQTASFHDDSGLFLKFQRLQFYA